MHQIISVPPEHGAILSASEYDNIYITLYNSINLLSPAHSHLGIVTEYTVQLVSKST